MKILVLGLDCAAPEILLGDDRLENLRRLMGLGCYGRLESVVPPITVPAWMCLCTSQDPGSLGVYGFRNRADRSYDRLQIVDSRSIDAVTIADQVGREGGKSVLIGVPPNYPPRKVNGISVGCFLTPDTTQGTFTHPPAISEEIRRLVGEYPVDVKGFRTQDKTWLRDQVLAMSRTQFAVVRHFLENAEWDYFHFVEIGLDRIQHGFWSHHDPAHRRHDPESPFRDAIRDYYRHLDAEIGSVLERLNDDTVVLVVSDHGARTLEGGFCINQWLVNEGLLVLNREPEGITPFAELDVNWERTTRLERGRLLRPRLPERPRDASRRGRSTRPTTSGFATTSRPDWRPRTGPDGRPLGTLVFKPEEIYREVRNVAPDLIVHFGALAWRSIGGVGYPTVHVFENDTGPDDCNHAQHGAFVLAAPNVPPIGEVEGAHLLDIAPTVLELAGYDVPPSMQGRSLLAGRSEIPVRPDSMTDGADIVRDRLSGLGYLG